jgi:hypothetical protein
MIHGVCAAPRVGGGVRVAFELPHAPSASAKTPNAMIHLAFLIFTISPWRIDRILDVVNELNVERLTRQEIFDFGLPIFDQAIGEGSSKNRKSKIANFSTFPRV